MFQTQNYLSSEWKRDEWTPAQLSAAWQNPQPADSDSARLIDWVKVCPVFSRRRAKQGRIRTEPRPRLRSAAEECAKSSVFISQTLSLALMFPRTSHESFGPAGAKTTCNHKDQQTLNSFYRGSPWPTTGRFYKKTDTHTHIQGVMKAELFSDAQHTVFMQWFWKHLCQKKFLKQSDICWPTSSWSSCLSAIF